ncbi:MAG: hypothetical protein JEZ06_00245 [Anaerolineaceae bacterium]|nr:hypothetical protein [Anaerolineaceae bacterium]
MSKFAESFNPSLEELKAVEALMDLRAEQWAKDNPGKTAGDWFGEQIAAVEMAEVKASFQELFQMDDGEFQRILSENATPTRDFDLTLDNWEADFGKEWKANTPIGDVYFSNDQYKKLSEKKGRKNNFGLIKPTLEEPTFILQRENGTILYIEAFQGKEKQVRFMSAMRDSEGIATVVSNYPVNIRYIKNRVKDSELMMVNILPTNLGGTSPMLGQLSVSTGTRLDSTSIANSESEFKKGSVQSE